MIFIYADIGQSWGQIVPKWDKTGDFLRSETVHFGSPSQNILNLILKKSHICPIWDQSATIWCQPAVNISVINPGMDAMCAVCTHPRNHLPCPTHQDMVLDSADRNCRRGGMQTNRIIVSFIILYLFVNKACLPRVSYYA